MIGHSAGSIAICKLFRSVEKSSLTLSVRNVLFLPLTREEKYNAKQAIDTFFVRLGDVLSAGLVFAGTTWLGLGMVGFAGVSLLLSDLLGKKRKSLDKGKAYESGMDPVGNARLRLSIHYYLVAVLFILFDVELIFLVPWAVSAAELGPIGFWMVGVFLVVLVVGLVYEWRAGGLEWDS